MNASMLEKKHGQWCIRENGTGEADERVAWVSARLPATLTPKADARQESASFCPIPTSSNHYANSAATTLEALIHQLIEISSDPLCSPPSFVLSPDDEQLQPSAT
jgi:hypothetical protein